MEGYSHGIQWWGGDSDVRRGGEHKNFGYLRNGVIENCRCSDIEGGGIWGSMGENIQVRGCSVSLCNDVGIDFEGCLDSGAEDCLASDCRNGNYSTFQYCTGKIVFRNCRSVFTGARDGVVGTCHYFNGNETQQADFQDVAFLDCRFESSVMSVIRPWHALHSFTLRRCTLKNTTIVTDAPRLDVLVLEDNRLTFDTPLGDGPAVRACINSPSLYGGPSLLVTGNTVSAPKSGLGISLEKLSEGAAAAVCRGNRLTGFGEKIAARNTGEGLFTVYGEADRTEGNTVSEP
ncbi:MAG: right-handed parallel beta-helix repeat-containing protein [Abditibacteriota bacterium]|nr:right-handed parallel beta-helix repeat-containing protein [Abditibacteriota bacterium]